MQQGSPQFWTRVAEVLGVSPQWLLTGVDAGEFELAEAKMALHDGDRLAGLAKARTLHAATGASRTLRSQAGSTLAAALIEEGRYDEAVEVLLDLLDGDDLPVPMELETRGRLIRALLECGDVAGATLQGQASVERAVELGVADTPIGVRLQVTLAAALIEAESWELAAHLLNRVRDSAALAGVGYAVWWNLALLARDRGDLGQAIHYANTALAELDGDAADDRFRLLVLWAAIAMALPEADHAQIKGILEQSLQVASAQGNAVDQGYAHTQLARLELNAGHTEQAIQHAEQAVAQLGGHPLPQLRAQTALASALIRSGQAHRAMRIAQTATASGHPNQIARFWKELAQHLVATGQHELALVAYGHAHASRTAAPSADNIQRPDQFQIQPRTDLTQVTPKSARSLPAAP